MKGHKTGDGLRMLLRFGFLCVFLEYYSEDYHLDCLGLLGTILNCKATCGFRFRWSFVDGITGFTG